MVAGDLSNPASIREAAKGVDKLFLLVAVVPDELTQAVITYGIAKQAGVRHVTYLSVYQVDRSAMSRTLPRSSRLKMRSGNSACRIRFSDRGTSFRTI